MHEDIVVFHMDRRAARFADGWVMGAGGSPEMFAQAVSAVEEAWRKAGRSEPLRKVKPSYFALGPGAREAAERELGRYYSVNWPDVAERLLTSAAIGEDAVRAQVEGFRQQGADELIFTPCLSDLEQIALLADAIA